MLFLSTLAGFWQMLVALFAFVVVLILSVVVTRWLGRFQQGNLANKNIRTIETFQLSTNKYIQIVQVGKKYIVIVVCKDTVTKLGELTEDEILEWPKEGESLNSSFSANFGEQFDKYLSMAKDRIKKK